MVVAFFLCWFSKLLCYLVCFSSLAGLLCRGQLSEHPLKVPTEAASASLSQEGGKEDQTFQRGHPERKQDSGYQVGLVGALICPLLWLFPCQVAILCSARQQEEVRTSPCIQGRSSSGVHMSLQK